MADRNGRWEWPMGMADGNGRWGLRTRAGCAGECSFWNIGSTGNVPKGAGGGWQGKRQGWAGQKEGRGEREQEQTLTGGSMGPVVHAIRGPRHPWSTPSVVHAIRGPRHPWSTPSMVHAVRGSCRLLHSCTRSSPPPPPPRLRVLRMRVPLPAGRSCLFGSLNGSLSGSTAAVHCGSLNGSLNCSFNGSRACGMWRLSNGSVTALCRTWTWPAPSC